MDKDTRIDTSRYDIAGTKAFAANVAAFYFGLIEGGMSEEDAMNVLLEWVTALVSRP